MESAQIEARADASLSDEDEPEGLTLGPLLALILSFVLVAGFVGYLIGKPGGESFNRVDVGFLDDMNYHHQSAIVMSFEYLAVQNDTVVSQIAEEIVRNQSGEITYFNTAISQVDDEELKSSIVDDDIAMDWMGEAVDLADMPGLPTAEELEALQAASGATADDLFTELMIEHHAAGVDMAEYVGEHGENETLRAFAKRMAANQRSEIGELNQRRTTLGLDPIDADTTSSSGHDHS